MRRVDATGISVAFTVMQELKVEFRLAFLSGTQVTRTLVRSGDQVVRGQALLDARSADGVVSVFSEFNGIISELLVNQGDRLFASQVLLRFSSCASSEVSVPGVVAKPAATADRAVNVKSERERFQAGRSGRELVASPFVRRVAGELGIDWRQVPNAPDETRVTMVDLRNVVQGALAAYESHNHFLSSPCAVPAAALPVGSVHPMDSALEQRLTVTPSRRVLMQRLKQSVSTIPHVTQFEFIDLSKVVELRRRHTEAFLRKGVRLTLTPVILYVLGKVLVQHPRLHCTLSEDESTIVSRRSINIGVVTELEDGLVIPVIEGVENMNMFRIASVLESLVKKARERTLSLEEMRGGGFTVTNQGAIGGEHFTPIIHLPQVAILGIGRAVQKPVVNHGQVSCPWLLPLSLSYDHRVVDGGSAVRFIQDIERGAAGLTDQDFSVESNSF